MVVVGAVGKVGLFGAVVAEYLSELAVCPLELAVCLLEAAVCPLEATVCSLEAFVSRLLLGSTVVEVAREDSMEAAAKVGAVGLPETVCLEAWESRLLMLAKLLVSTWSTFSVMTEGCLSSVMTEDNSSGEVEEEVEYAMSMGLTVTTFSALLEGCPVLVRCSNALEVEKSMSPESMVSASASCCCSVAEDLFTTEAEVRTEIGQLGEWFWFLRAGKR